MMNFQCFYIKNENGGNEMYFYHRAFYFINVKHYKQQKIYVPFMKTLPVMFISYLVGSEEIWKTKNVAL